MKSEVQLPGIAHTQLRWFTTYVRGYVKRNFHGLHLLRDGDLSRIDNRPLLVVLNHPSWWDPLIGVLLSQTIFANRDHFAPIASAGLAKYKFFQRLGFFGIDPTCRSGAERFLSIGCAVLSQPAAALWVTPQGHFADVREPKLRLQAGVGHLAERCPGIAVLPVALEYAFWNERRPEAFVCFGKPIVDPRKLPAKEWTALISSGLQATQEKLAANVIARDPAAFEPLVEGAAGVGGVYDMWRAAKARLGGKKFEAGHGRI